MDSAQERVHPGWRRVSEVICDRRIAGEVKGQTYKMVVRPAVTHDFETKRWKAELKMLGFHWERPG